MANAAIDNDVILKGVCYGFLGILLGSLPDGPFNYGILGTARFVLPKALKKRPPKRFDVAKADLKKVLAEFETLEPTDTEAALAADLEFEAQRQGLPVHAGECQLIAMLALRNLDHVLTGDRNAIKALATLTLPVSIEHRSLEGKFICFEQAILHLIAAHGAARVREAICAERDVDTSMRLCFSCSSPEVPQSSWISGINSHVADLRSVAGPLLR
ncbi:hypothetical protein [Dyella sedimenti]|uniref:hypothetical protein n=1 Tax=Dyella sedimenti TaxID=2919947 RepID=UPI001FAAF8DF|nr:hypothetical protein [Dyella sedimenti]